MSTSTTTTTTSLLAALEQARQGDGPGPGPGLPPADMAHARAEPNPLGYVAAHTRRWLYAMLSGQSQVGDGFAQHVTTTVIKRLMPAITTEGVALEDALAALWVAKTAIDGVCSAFINDRDDRFVGEDDDDEEGNT